MPAWATVVVALVASAIGGVAASFLTTYLQIKHQRDEQLRQRMVDAADEFTTGVRQARTALLHARDAVIAGRQDERLKYFEESDRLIDEASARLARVHLLFGTGSAAGEAGTVAISLMTNLVDYMREEEPGEVHRSEDWGRLRAAMSVFNRGALRTIRNPSAALDPFEEADSMNEALAQLGIP